VLAEQSGQRHDQNEVQLLGESAATQATAQQVQLAEPTPATAAQ